MPKHERMKSFIEGHPLKIVIGVSVATGLVVAGVMAYYANQQHRMDETLSKAKLKNIATMYEAEINDEKDSSDKRIADLNSRLASITRRIPGAGPSYVNVSALTISRSQEDSLGVQYRPFDDGAFYLASPLDKAWKFTKTTFFAYRASMFVGEDITPSQLSGISKQISNAPVYEWKRKTPILFETESGEKLKIFPSITVRPISAKFYRAQARAAGNLVQTTEDDAEINSIIKAINKLSKTLGSTESAAPTSTSVQKKAAVQKKAVVQTNASVERKADVQKKDTVDKATVQNIKSADHALDADVDVGSGQNNQVLALVNDLSNVAAVDIATTTLIADLYQNFFYAVYFKGIYRMFSAQKKGNVFYVRSQLEFPHSSIISKNTVSSKEDVIIDEEEFFVGTGTGGFKIDIYIPRTKSRYKTYVWTKQWLAGLKVVLG